MRILITLFLLCFYCLVFGQHHTLWSFETKGRIYTSPLLNDNVLYFGSGDSTFYALNKSTGESLWQYKSSGAIYSEACLFNNLVLFSNTCGGLQALNKNSGELMWKFTAGNYHQYDLWDYYTSSPVVEGETVFLGSSDSCMYALNVNTGAVRWKYKTNGIIHASATVIENKVLFGSFDGNLYCLDKETGRKLWSFKTLGAEYFPKGEIQRSCTVYKGKVYFGSRDYNLYALDLNTGRVLWNFREPAGWIIAPPLILNNKVYFGTSDAHKFYCLDANNGNPLWEYALQMRVYSKASSQDSSIVFGTFDGKVLALHQESGMKLWEYHSKESKINAHTVYDIDGYFKPDFQLYGDEETTENSELMIHNLGAILGTPILEDGILYFGNSIGSFYAIKLNTY